MTINIEKISHVKLKKDYKEFKAGTFLYQDMEGDHMTFDLRNYEKDIGYAFRIKDIKENSDLFEFV